MQFFEGLMNRIDDARAQRVIVHCAHNFFRLYGDVFRAIDGAQGRQLREGGARHRWS